MSAPRLSDKHRQIMALLARSPIADGWIEVSNMLISLIAEAPPELVEVKSRAGKHFARFSPEGLIVKKWIL